MIHLAIRFGFALLIVDLLAFFLTNCNQTFNPQFIKQSRNELPDESCRKCGGNLIDCSLCAQCKGVIGMICVSCGTRTMEQFHDSCLYLVEQIQTTTDRNQNGYLFQKIISLT